jgi:hypothetical protein
MALTRSTRKKYEAYYSEILNKTPKLTNLHLYPKGLPSLSYSYLSY